MGQLLPANRGAFGQRAGQRLSPVSTQRALQLRTYASVSRVRGAMRPSHPHIPSARRLYVAAGPAATAHQQPHRVYPKSSRRRSRPRMLQTTSSNSHHSARGFIRGGTCYPRLQMQQQISSHPLTMHQHGITRFSAAASGTTASTTQLHHYHPGQPIDELQQQLKLMHPSVIAQPQQQQHQQMNHVDNLQHHHHHHHQQCPGAPPHWPGLVLKVVVFMRSCCFDLALHHGCTVGWIRQQIAEKLGAQTTPDTLQLSYAGRMLQPMSDEQQFTFTPGVRQLHVLMRLYGG